MSNFKKNQKVVWVISVMGSKTASIKEVESVKQGVVILKDEQSLKFRDGDGTEINPAIPGCSSHIIELE